MGFEGPKSISKLPNQSLIRVVAGYLSRQCAKNTQHVSVVQGCDHVRLTTYVYTVFCITGRLNFQKFIVHRHSSNSSHMGQEYLILEIFSEKFPSENFPPYIIQCVCMALVPCLFLGQFNMLRKVVK